MTRLLNVNDANDEDGHGFGGSDNDKDALLSVNDANDECGAQQISLFFPFVTVWAAHVAQKYIPG